ncbi:MAG: amidohydrolase family protein [Phycisphaerales bacterium]|nr:amidohydrolase family protein [Phycisphaerales bacterium]
MSRRGTVRAAIAVVAGACAATASGQDLTHKAGPQGRPVVLSGGTVHTVSGETIQRGYVLFRDGKIEAVAREPLPRFSDAGSIQIIDVTGLHVFPGMISADTQLGLVEFPPIRVTVDTGEIGEVSPEVRPSVAVNPDSTLLPVTRTNGILTAAIMPSGGPVAGQVSVIRLDGWTTEEMTVKGCVGVLVNWPNVRPITAWWMDRSADDQLKEIRERIATIDDTFKTARAYAAAREADASSPVDLRWEAMRGVFEGEKGKRETAPVPVFISANERDQITSAVSWAAEMGVRVVIVGGRDAVECAELLKRHDVAVIVEGTFAFPRRDDAPYDDAYSLPARLHAAGVKFCMSCGDRTANERNLPYAAGMAVAHGLPVEAAHRAIMLWPAQILGVGDTLGSLEVGKSASIIVTDGDPLEITTNVRMAFIDGRKVDLRNKQTELAAKYREKYLQQKAGGRGNVESESDAGSGGGQGGR